MLDANNPYQSPATAYASGTPYVQVSSAAAFRPASTLVLVLTVLLGAHAVLDVAWLAIGAMELNVYRQGRNFESDQPTSTEISVMLAMAGVGLLQVLVYLTTIVAWCIWNVRAYKNLLALGASRLQHSPGWAAGAWFVPILNWFRPCQIMQEIWKGSDPANLRREDSPYARIPGSALVGWWWATWLIGNIVNQISFRLEWQAAGDLSMLQGSAIASIAGSAVTIVCAVLAIQILRTLDWRQFERHQLLSGGRTPDATWQRK